LQGAESVPRGRPVVKRRAAPDEAKLCESERVAKPSISRRASLARVCLTAFSVLSALSVLACSPPAKRSEVAAEKVRAGRMQLVVTVDWEGRDLRDENLQAIAELRRRFPDVKLVHFLNAAYFTKPDAAAERVKAAMESVIRAGDEKGLHIHGWKRLFEAAGVTFRSEPTFWGTSLGDKDCLFDCGHEVPIDLYTTEELRRVVRFSIDTLRGHGFGSAKSFRCGGWIARPNVRDAIAAEGLVYEHSMVPTRFVEAKLTARGGPLYPWLRELWGDASPLTQPREIPTSAGPLVEVPDNGALADYVTADQMVDVFEQNKAAFLADRNTSVVVSIGFHQETAAKYLPALEEALSRIQSAARAEKIPLESVTSDAVVRRRST